MDDEPYFRFGSDMFDIQSKFYCDPHIEPLLERLLHGHFHCMREMALTGNNLIVDVVLEAHGLLEECVKNLCDLNAYFVGVRCPLEEIERREIARGDRVSGMAKGQFKRVHAHEIYDIEVDTSCHTPEEMAQTIQTYVQAHPPNAFQQIRKKFNIDPSDPSFSVEW